uniref:Uncharacterized protein n=1 Tax=Plectus sambesii TaxID=2011161 RepID=A0A914UL45_9BILA
MKTGRSGGATGGGNLRGLSTAQLDGPNESRHLLVCAARQTARPTERWEPDRSVFTCRCVFNKLVARARPTATNERYVRTLRDRSPTLHFGPSPPPRPTLIRCRRLRNPIGN